jgi:hypothetical protein
MDFDENEYKSIDNEFENDMPFHTVPSEDEGENDCQGEFPDIGD